MLIDEVQRVPELWLAIKNAVDRMARLTTDPDVTVLDQHPDLQDVLRRLAREFSP